MKTRQQKSEPPIGDQHPAPEPPPGHRRRPFDTVRLELDALQAMLGPPLDSPTKSPEDQGRDPP